VKFSTFSTNSSTIPNHDHGSIACPTEKYPEKSLGLFCKHRGGATQTRCCASSTGCRFVTKSTSSCLWWLATYTAPVYLHTWVITSTLAKQHEHHISNKNTANIRKKVITQLSINRETSMVYLASTRCLPCRVCWSATPILATCRVDIGSAYMLKTGVDNISNLSVVEKTRFFERYLNRHCSSSIFNDSQLQSVASKFCGHYCIYFCLLRDRGINMCKFISNFTSDTGLNDVLVHASVRRRLYKQV